MSVDPPGGDRRELRADCRNCFALCCVVPAFSASADFAIDKPAEQPCPHLSPDSRCSIHAQLRPRGFAGCTVYDCFGAGQKVSRITFGGTDWRGAPSSARLMFGVFPVMRQLHELLWYLTEAARLRAAQPLHHELRRLAEETERLTMATAETLLSLDVAAHRGRVNAVLVQASELARAGPPHRGRDHRGADLIGADLRGTDLRGANLRGATLIGADLREANLERADVIGADLRGADLRGADLTASIFLIQSQLDSARGDDRTAVPAALRRPTHWSVTRSGVRDG